MFEGHEGVVRQVQDQGVQAVGCLGGGGVVRPGGRADGVDRDPGLQQAPWECNDRVERACLPACLPACLRACVLACLHACVPVCLHACVPACLRACVPACLRAC
eukprot:13805293-Alexandrium_andersonii.AAC.1